MATIDLEKPLSQRAFAKIVGLTPGRVSQLVAEGTLSEGATAGTWLGEYLSHLREVAAGRADTPAAQHSRERILAAEAHRREEMARLASTKRKETEGELLRRADVLERYTAKVVESRSVLLSGPTRLTPLLVGARDRAAVYRILNDWVHDALTRLAGKPPAGHP